MGVTCGRFFFNTTLGLAGIFDPATSFGLERHDSDFGQTLALAGVQPGIYLVVPVLGPVTVRDGFGAIVDSAMRPTAYLLGFDQMLLFGGSVGLATREEHHLEIAALKKSAMDYYTVLRSAYYQNRVGEIWERREHRHPEAAGPDTTYR
jgi:phospholipid-binding lipoprotein MlaA